MDYSKTENEQVDFVKDVFKRYGLLLIVLIALMMGGWFGYKYWKQQQVENLDAVVDVYTQLFDKLESKKDTAAIEAMSAFSKTTDTVYSVLANMEIAKVYVQQKEYPKALDALLAARQNSKDVELSNLINFRIARLHYQLGKFDEALHSIDLIKEKAWAPITQDLKGDIYSTQQKYQEALDAYQPLLAIDSVVVDKRMLKMKINNVQYQLAMKEKEVQKPK